jgi:hypothetical protein
MPLTGSDRNVLIFLSNSGQSEHNPLFCGAQQRTEMIVRVEPLSDHDDRSCMLVVGA